jgi:hypothetical protein
MASIVIKSKPFSFIPEDVKSILTGAGIAGAGAFLTFLAESLGKLNFGEWTPFVVAFLSIVVNAAKKWITTTTYAK